MRSHRVLNLCVLPLFLGACGASEGTAGVPGGAQGGTSSAGGSGAQGGIGAAGGGGQVGPACVLFTFTTLDNGGRYSPNNVSAVWVTNPAGAFVRTLEENGYIRERHLTAWELASGGNTVDAVTGATNRAPRTHEAAWDCADPSQAPVPPGAYTLNAEFATDNGGFSRPPFLQVGVPIGQGPQAIHPPDEQYFVDISVVVE